MASHWGDPDWEEKTKHLNYTLKCFRFWGCKVGLIAGDTKEKWGEPRWSARIMPIEDLHGIFKAGHFYYRWGPENGMRYIVLDALNNWSKFFFALWPIMKLTLYWKLFFYNVAYWLPMLKYPAQAHEILHAGNYPRLVLFGERYAKYMGIKLGSLTSAEDRDAE